MLHLKPEVFAATFVLLGSLTVNGQEPSASPRNKNEPATGTITGTVVSENGQPLPGATLFVRPLNSAVSGRTTTTNIDGNFRIGGLEPALYSVSATSPAYTTVQSDPGTPIYYRIGDSVRLELVRGGVITGTVTNGVGEPVIAVRVRATMVKDGKGQTPKMIGFAGLEQPTDDRGVYRIYGLPPGTYLVSAGGASQMFQLNPYDSDIPTFAPSSTRDNAAEVTVRAGEESSADIRYRGESGHSISGTVREAGTNGATIMLMSVGSFTSIASAFQLPGNRGFAFHGLADGEYDLLAQEISSGQNMVMPLLSVSEVKRVTVKGGSVTGIELVTRPLSTISGRIVLESSKLPECQGKRPPLFAETVVRLQRPENESQNIFQRMFGGTVSPEPNGTFVVRNLSPGRYQFDPHFYARYWYLRSITMGAAPPVGARPQTSTSRGDAAANWTTVKQGDQLSNLTITLTEGAASIRGKLTLPEGAPVPSGFVYLLPSEPNKTDDVLRFFVTEIGAGGAFAFNNLPPGKYWSLMQSVVDPQIATTSKLRHPEAAPMRTKLRRIAEARKNEIELKPCQNLTDYQLSTK